MNWIVRFASLGCVLAVTACKPEQPPPKPKSEVATAVAVPHLLVTNSAPPSDAPKIDSARAMRYLREIVAFGPRPPGSHGYRNLQRYLRQQLKNDDLEADAFTAATPIGEFKLTNFIAKYPGSTDQVVVIASHYETNYPLKNFVGANDAGSSTALLLELANHLRGPRKGPTVWLVWLDGEEPFKEFSETDSFYGSRHLASKWQQDGTAKRIKAFILTDMIGDKDLNIDKDLNSTPWLSDLVYTAASNLGVQSFFYRRQTLIQDDHLAFSKIGIPVVDVIDLDYGYNNVFHHTPEDTLDKVSARSLRIVGDVVLETVRLLSQD
jgi:hypothetical protein